MYCATQQPRALMRTAYTSMAAWPVRKLTPDAVGKVFQLVLIGGGGGVSVAQLHKSHSRHND